MKAKIISFNKKEGQDYDCIAITDKGEKVIVDPFVGCSWEYENREQLLNEWFEDTNAWLHETGVWLTSDKTFILLGRKELTEAYLRGITDLKKMVLEEWPRDGEWCYKDCKNPENCRYALDRAEKKLIENV